MIQASLSRHKQVLKSCFQNPQNFPQGNSTAPSSSGNCTTAGWGKTLQITFIEKSIAISEKHIHKLCSDGVKTKEWQARFKIAVSRCVMSIAWITTKINLLNWFIHKDVMCAHKREKKKKKRAHVSLNVYAVMIRSYFICY